MPLRILHQDDFLVAVDKPAGFHVHPPEDARMRLPDTINCLAILRNQLGRYVYPVHRLDPPTSGVLLYALDSETAGLVAALFRERKMEKTYCCVVRGWVEEEGSLDRPLASEKDSERTIPSLTHFRRLGRIELPRAVGRYPTARYSFVQAHPVTGRYHQIRRHFAGASHPLIGDTVRGDGAHNRYFRNDLQIPQLLLKCQRLEFRHPRTGEALRLHSRWNGNWHRIFELFGVCPL